MARKRKKRGKKARSPRKARPRRMLLLAALTAVVIAALLYTKPWAGQQVSESGATQGSTSSSYYWIIIPEEVLVKASEKLMKEYIEGVGGRLPGSLGAELYKTLSYTNNWCRLAEDGDGNLTERYVALYVDSGKKGLVESFFKEEYHLSSLDEYRSVYGEPSLQDLVASILNASSNPKYWLVVKFRYVDKEKMLGLLERNGVEYIYIRPKPGSSYVETAVRLVDAPTLLKLLQASGIALIPYPALVPVTFVPT